MFVTKNSLSINVFNCLFIMGFHLIAIASPILLPNNNTVILYTKRNFKGPSATLNVSRCISQLTSVLNGSTIGSLDPKDHCVDIYQGEYCTGQFITIKRGRPASENLKRWDSKSWKFNQAKSIGPCEDECSSKYIQTPKPSFWKKLVGLGKITVELNDGINFRGDKTKTLEVEKGCTIIPKNLRRQASSAKVNGDYCIELYEKWDCSGYSIQLTQDIPSQFTGDLASWNFDKKAVAASPCSYKCIKDQPKYHKVTFISPGKNVLTIFNEPGFQFKGGYKDLILKDGECLKIPNVWEIAETIESILTYGRCIEIFEKDRNCNRSNGKTLRLNDSESDVLARGWNNGMKSIAVCPKETIIVDDTKISNATKGIDDKIIVDETKISYVTKGIDDTIIVDETNIYNATTGIDETIISNETILINHTKIANIRKIADYTRIENDASDPPSNGKLESPNSIPTTYIISSIFILVIILTASYIIKLKISNQRLSMLLSRQEIYEFRRGTTFTGNLGKPNENNYVLPQNQPYDQRYEIPREHIHFDINSILGEGEFGIVYRGRTNPPTFSKECIVAVKSPKPFCEVEYVRAMLKEIKIMIHVGQHPNIVQLIGCYTKNLARAELFILTELCASGSLLTFLQNYEHSFDSSTFQLTSTVKDGSANTNYKIMLESNFKIINGSNFSFVHLLQWSLQIAQGMEHLSGTNVIHGDLAARNVLLDEDFTAKISDFGLSKQLYVDVNYMKKSKVPLPWRGMALETLRSLQFSIESDIWAFGMTLWEIFTLGGLPYPGKVWDVSFLDELANGLRPSQPKYATNELYSLMMSCWNEIPDLRVPFAELTQKLEESLDNHLKKNSDQNKHNVTKIAFSSNNYHNRIQKPIHSPSSLLSTFGAQQKTFLTSGLTPPRSRESNENLFSVQYSK